MGKKEFEFYQDVKVTVWARQKFSVEAESKEEALKMVEEFKIKDIGVILIESVAQLGNCVVEVVVKVMVVYILKVAVFAAKDNVSLLCYE